MEALRIVQKMVWGPWLLGLFLAVGVLCMVRLRGFPIRHIRVWWGETVGSGGVEGEVGLYEGSGGKDSF